MWTSSRFVFEKALGNRPKGGFFEILYLIASQEEGIQLSRFGIVQGIKSIFAMEFSDRSEVQPDADKLGRG